MINKLRIKFILITMGALILLLIAILITANLVMQKASERETNDFLQRLFMSDGKTPDIPQKNPVLPPNQPPMIEFFSVKLDENNTIIEIINRKTGLEDERAEELAMEAFESGKEEGTIEEMKYLIEDKSYGKIIIFADQTLQNVLLRELRDLSYTIGIISIIVIFVIVLFLSKLVTKPVAETFEKQKRFISDSGHELKTPLSILAANADMLELEQGKNQWLSQIKQQSKRMNKLIHELLLLARIDDSRAKIQFREFNLSQRLINTILPLEVIAFEQKKEIKFEIAENIFYRGNEKNITAMLEALLDNAIKYSDEKSTIFVKLYLKGSKKIIEVQNKGKKISEKSMNRIFEKFYRVDDSRARETGGYGLGLSIVKNIVDLHKGKIEVDCKHDGMITFRVTI